MLIYSMGVSVDGFIADREGAFGWTVPSDEQFRFHVAQVGELGGYLCGRRLYETMLLDRRRRPRRGGNRARPRRWAAHVPLSGRRRWGLAVSGAGHRRRRAGPDRDQDAWL